MDGLLVGCCLTCTEMRHSLAVLAAVTLLAVGACGGDPAPAGSADPSADPQGAELLASPSPSPTPEPMVEPEGELCQRVGEMEMRLAALQTVELKLVNRTALEVDLDQLMAAFEELSRTDLGDREDQLDPSLTRLGYRLVELGLAVEDFRTNSRPRRAAPNVEEDTGKVADELAAFVILSRC